MPIKLPKDETFIDWLKNRETFENYNVVTTDDDRVVVITTNENAQTAAIVILDTYRNQVRIIKNDDLLPNSVVASWMYESNYDNVTSTGLTDPLAVSLRNLIQDYWP